jgi:hypothetical protein
MGFSVHLIVPTDGGPIPGSTDPRFAAPGTPTSYSALCDPQLGLPKRGEHALTAHPPAATCEKCKAKFRETLRAPQDPEPEPEATPPLDAPTEPVVPNTENAAPTEPVVPNGG